jgi:hypothetical protein
LEGMGEPAAGDQSAPVEGKTGQPEGKSV